MASDKVVVQGACDVRFAEVRSAFGDNFVLRGEVGAAVAICAR